MKKYSSIKEFKQLPLQWDPFQKCAQFAGPFDYHNTFSYMYTGNTQICIQVIQ